MSDLHEAFEATLVTRLPQPIYVAGPMSGLPEWNHPAFAAATAQLRAWGLVAFSPHELHPEVRTLAPADALPWDVYMHDAIRQLLQCRALILLPGWTASRGAMAERELAARLHMPMALYYPEPRPHVIIIDGAVTLAP